MPLKIDDIFPDQFPFSLDDFFHTFEKLRERSEEVIKLDRIEFDDPTFLLYLFKGEFAVVDPKISKIKFVGSDVAITSVIIIFKEILTGIFAIAHISNEFNVEECLAQILVKLITHAQSNRLAMLEPMMEISIFGGFSCGYETTDSSNADDTDDTELTFSYPEDSRSEVNDPAKFNAKSSNKRRPSAIEIASKITNECDLLVLRILYALFTSRIIFDLSVLCSGSINTEICERRDRERPLRRNRLSVTRLVGRLRRLSATGVDHLKRRFSSFSGGSQPPPLDSLHGGPTPTHALSDALQEVRGYMLRSRHLRRYHCPRVTGIAYEVSSASYFPVTRFTPGVEGLVVGPNAAMRFARTCIPMLLPSYCYAHTVSDEYVNTNDANSSSTSRSVSTNTLTLRAVDVYDTISDTLVLNFGSIKKLLAQAHGMQLRAETRRRMSGADGLECKAPNVPAPPKPLSEKIATPTQRSYDSLKTSTNIEIEMRGMLKRISYLLGETADISRGCRTLSDSDLIQLYYYPDMIDEPSPSSSHTSTGIIGSSCALEYLELEGNESLKSELAQDIRSALTFLRFDLGVPNRDDGNPVYVVHEAEAFGDDKIPVRYKLDRIGRWNLRISTNQ